MPGPTQEPQAGGSTEDGGSDTAALQAPAPKPPARPPRWGVTYPVELDDRYLAQVSIPLDLSEAECRRLSRFLSTLIVPWRCGQGQERPELKTSCESAATLRELAQDLLTQTHRRALTHAADELDRLTAQLVLQQKVHEREMLSQRNAMRQRCASLCEAEGAKWRGAQDISDFKLCAQVIRDDSEATPEDASS